MKKSNRTRLAPFLDILRPGQRMWKWTIELEVASSGYVTDATVIAHGGTSADPIVGSATSRVPLGGALEKALPELAIEACLSAMEPPLPGIPGSPRKLEWSDGWY